MSIHKILNSNITSKWLKFYFTWERNYSLENLNLILYLQPHNTYIHKNVRVNSEEPEVYNPI